MTEDEFLNKYRGRFLLFITEAWACRSRPPSELGLTLELHHRQLEVLLKDIFRKHVVREESKPAVPQNGTAQQKASVK